MASYFCGCKLTAVFTLKGKYIQTFQGYLSFLFLPPFSMGVISQRKEFAPVEAQDGILERFLCRGKQTGSPKNIYFCKNDEKA